MIDRSRSCNTALALDIAVECCLRRARHDGCEGGWPPASVHKIMEDPVGLGSCAGR